MTGIGPPDARSSTHVVMSSVEIVRESVSLLKIGTAKHFCERTLEFVSGSSSGSQNPIPNYFLRRTLEAEAAGWEGDAHPARAPLLFLSLLV